MAAKPIQSQSDLKKLLRYDPETGFMYWTGHLGFPQTPMRKSGMRAFLNKTVRGYYRGGLLGRNVMAHRVVWKWHFGTEPDEIDHIDGNPSNNRIENLRAATRSENLRNMKLRKTNKSGVQGVYFHTRDRRWISSICHEGRQIELGTYKCFCKAVKLRKSAEKLYGYHPNHGRFHSG